MVSLEFFSDINLPVALWPWGRLSLWQKWVPGVFPGGKGSRCTRLTTLPRSYAVVMKSENLNFLQPSGPIQACNGTALPLLTHHEICRNGPDTKHPLGHIWIYHQLQHHLSFNESANCKHSQMSGSAIWWRQHLTFPMTFEFLTVLFQQPALTANGLSHHRLTTTPHYGSQLLHRGFWRGTPPTGATYKCCWRFRYMTRCSQSGAMVWPLNSTYHSTVHHGHWDGKPTGLPGHWYLQKERWFLAGVCCPWGLQPSQNFIGVP